MLRIDKAISQKTIRWMAPALVAVFLLAIINSLFFKIVRVPADDMRMKYQKGDIVWLSKLSSDYHKNASSFLARINHKPDLAKRDCFVRTKAGR